MNKTHDPLVSVIVLTYNSLDYVLETLESVKQQSYKKIELIITDDGSSDKTVSTCETWLLRNKKWFIQTRLITTEKNTGVPANCNRGIKAAKGEWIKFIGGDDLLLKDCIKNNIDNTVKNAKIKIQFSKQLYFKALNGEKQIIEDLYFKENYRYYNIDNEEQYKVLLVRNFLIAPTSFFKATVFYEIGLFDESIKGIEDYPFWLKASQKGYKFYFFDKETVMYRKSEINSSSLPRMHLYMKKIFFKYRFIPLLKYRPYYAYDRFIFYTLIPLILKNKYFKVFYYVLSPLSVFKSFSNINP
ncbi:glycosyltransferase [Saccharicrinis sp. FJH54]|uniref:glycosyltransferase n=1 Tax=Saccharicrinis sp. FJH54 TaxID=3344665 RepID=UPI0035D4E8EA